MFVVKYELKLVIWLDRDNLPLYCLFPKLVFMMGNLEDVKKSMLFPFLFLLQFVLDYAVVQFQ